MKSSYVNAAPATQPCPGREGGEVPLFWSGRGALPLPSEQTENITFPYPSDAGGKQFNFNFLCAISSYRALILVY